MTDVCLIQKRYEEFWSDARSQARSLSESDVERDTFSLASLTSGVIQTVSDMLLAPTSISVTLRQSRSPAVDEQLQERDCEEDPAAHVA